MPEEIKGILDAFLAQNTPETNTNLDLENPYELGGPINDAASGFEQKYTPQNPYYTTNEGVVGLESQLKEAQTTDPASSALNLKTDEADGIGGPNRVTPTIPGEYRNYNAGGMGYIAGEPGKELNKVQLQQYTPDKPYFQPGRAVPAGETNHEPDPHHTPQVPGNIDATIAPKESKDVGKFTDI